MNLDEEIIAGVDLVGRTGAKDLQFGYLHDDVPVEQAGWYAHAQYRGARVTVEDQPGPIQALETLCRRLLEGGRCRCGRLVALSDDGAVAWDRAHLVDGTRWDAEDAAKAGLCRWRREGPKWIGACGAGGTTEPTP